MTGQELIDLLKLTDLSLQIVVPKEQIVVPRDGTRYADPNRIRIAAMRKVGEGYYLELDNPKPGDLTVVVLE